MSEICAGSGDGNGGRRAVVSIKEVAKIAGVSIATVSRCINSPEKVTESTRLRVQRAIDDTGYAPNALARNFRRGRTNIILVVMPSVGDPFFAAIMRGIHAAATSAGYSVVIEETNMRPTTTEKHGVKYVASQADGVILLCNVAAEELGILNSANRNDLPIVVGFEATSQQLVDYPGVHIDNAAAAAEATRHLIELGHERIAIVSGTEQLGLTIDRESGFRSAMAAAELEVDTGWVVDGGLTIEGARRATEQLLLHPRRPTAVFCASDEMAIGCLHQIKAAGLRVPDDMSVIGFDDIRYAEVTDPPLTTIRQPSELIGRRAIECLCRVIEGNSNEDSPSETIPHELVIRKSTAPPKLH